jgi:hypothetical protein
MPITKNIITLIAMLIVGAVWIVYILNDYECTIAQMPAMPLLFAAVVGVHIIDRGDNKK